MYGMRGCRVSPEVQFRYLGWMRSIDAMDAESYNLGDRPQAIAFNANLKASSVHCPRRRFQNGP